MPSTDPSIRTALGLACLVPLVVVVVTAVAYYSFAAWVLFIVECLQTAQRWGWWP